ncbi:metal ABC transporter ATPase [Atopomonas sediminilitoris]|uniref:metal ABC transporter ATPase n=1 Tax=Atopomonas sediminilitoris TaxID=2919919 RepID=UPI001F4F0570|nr:metal ABC transporter ATPase [Atopomonas sediminilitoris]MCJ8170296.1 metal ABC transporter ATPase [Atopomonas sediminilitoris]
MSDVLISKDPHAFITQPLLVEARHEQLTYQPLAQALNFQQMLARRVPIEVSDQQHFTTELANLGVSVRLTLPWQGRDYALLVQQERPDRADCVLKLISGYVPSHLLDLPLLCALEEIAEECLIETAHGFLPGRYDCVWLPTPYANHLSYHKKASYQLVPRRGSARPIKRGSLTLQERPNAYVHTPTASLQLIYDLRLELPSNLGPISLWHVDEHLEGEHLVARLDRRRPRLFLAPINEHGLDNALFTLQNDQLVPVDTRDLWLSEGFVRPQHWLVQDSHIHWQDYHAA